MRLDERGLTIAEILVAVAVIGLGLAGLFVAVPVGTFGIQEGNQQTTATFLAQQRLEQARHAQWTAVPNIDCLGVGAATAPPTTATGCNVVAPAIGAGAETFPDENNIQWGNDTRAGTSTAAPLANGYTRTTRITQCTAATCAGITPNPPVTTDMRLVTVTVRYAPLSGAGAAAATKAVTLSWVVSQK